MAGNVLLIEPEKHHRRVFAAALTGSNYEVCEQLADEQGALEAYSQHKPEVVIVSIRLPKMKSGLDLMKALHEHDPKAKVVATYDFATAHLQKKAAMGGAFACLQKPFKRSAVLDVLGQAIKTTDAASSADGAEAGGLRAPLAVHYRLASERSSAKQDGVCQHISRTGMVLRAPTTCPPTSQLDIEIELPQSRQPVRAMADVVSARPIHPNGPYSLTLQFAKLSPKDAKRINTLFVEATAYERKRLTLKQTVPVMLKRKGLLPTKQRRGYCTEISVDGMVFKSRARFKVGAKLSIACHLPNTKHPIKAIVTVQSVEAIEGADVHKHFVGFEDIDVLVQGAIRKFTLAADAEERKREESSRRVSERVPVSMCTLECSKPGILRPLNQPQKGRYVLADLSRKGAQIISDHYHMEGDAIELRIRPLGQQQELVLMATVRWVRESEKGKNIYRMGLKFEGTSAQDWMRLSRLKNALAKKPPGHQSKG